MAKDKPLGKVNHYFDKAMVAVIKLDGSLKVGDEVKFVKGEDEFSQTIDSMQIEHESIRSAKKGQEAAVKVSQPAREGTLVYKT